MTSLTELKPGYRLNVLMALAMIGAPTTKERLTDESGVSDETVRDVLRWLSKPEQSLALCIPNGRHPLWMLSATARRWLQPLREMLDRAEQVSPLPADSNAHKTLEPAKLSPLPADSDNAHNQVSTFKAPEHSENQALLVSPLAADSDPGVVVVLESNLLKESHTTTPERDQALEALRALRVPLAKAEQVLEKTPFSLEAVVAQAQAWAAYRDSGATDLNRALLPNLAAARIRTGDLCPYDPPAPRIFSAPAADPVFDDDALAIPEPERLWHQVLEQLRRQMTAQAFELVASTALAPGAEPGAWMVLCPTRFTHDWLSNRLAGTIQRELTAAAGAAINITFASP